MTQQTGLRLGYIEQLYTFGDRDRAGPSGARALSVAYLALTRQSEPNGAAAPRWSRLYDFFPWEDWRGGPPQLLEHSIHPALRHWADHPHPAAPAEGGGRTGGGSVSADRRRERAQIVFGLDGAPWDRNRVLDRYELLYESNLVEEAARDSGAPSVGGAALPGDPSGPSAGSGPSHVATGRTFAGQASVRPGGSPAADRGFGRPMVLDHRRIAATALERMRGKLSYRPVVFELLPDSFTLLQLQRVVEALAGERTHKQNFRRLVEQSRMVERTGQVETRTGGRPAELFRFRREVLLERPAPGLGLPRRRLAR
ncbi:MAG: NAD regulator [Actinomycetota bacterium]|nr:NAD regulator [Actinomycetota bacterium]